MDIVLKEQQGKIVFLTLNRPEKRNALNVSMIDALKKYFKELNDDNSVRVIVLKANGEAFCSGADLEYLQQLQKNTYEENLQDSEKLASLFSLIYTNKKIVISLVDGAALAGGCGLASVCDFCFATPESKFGYTEVKIGFIPAIVSFFLLRKIGEASTKDLLLTGKIIKPEEASKIGLINEVIDKGNIQNYVLHLAEKLCIETSPSSVELTKKLINEISSLSFQEAAFLNKEKLEW